MREFPSTSAASRSSLDLLRLFTESSLDASKIESHLQSLSTDELSAVLIQRNTQQKTLLHLAVDRADLEVIKVLLSFDASIDIKLGDQNLEEYAKALADRHQDEQQYKQAYALIKSRGRWQREAQREQGLSFARSIKAVEDTVDKIQGAHGNTGVLFLGLTGAGKSTLINYLCGVEYREIEKHGVPQVIPRSDRALEIARVGNSTSSATLLPQVITLPDVPYVLVDLPGFGDTRGSAEEICAAAGIDMLTRQLGGVQALLFVVSWDALKDSRMNPYRDTAESVGAMISLYPETAENVILVVTKPENTSEARVRARLSYLAEEEGWFSDEPPMVDTEEMTGDQKPKHYLKLATQAILNGQNNIILADVLSSRAKNLFESIIATLDRKIKSPQAFDFKNYSRYMENFKIVMESIISKYNQLARQETVLLEQEKTSRAAISEAEKEKRDFEETIAACERQKNQAFTAESFEKTLQDARSKLEQLRSKLRQQEQLLHDAEVNLLAKSTQKQSFDHEGEGEKLIREHANTWTCEQLPDQEQAELAVMGTARLWDGRTANFVELEKHTIKGKKQTVSENMSYTSPIPISRFVANTEKGRFEAKAFIPGAKELKGKFTSNSGVVGKVALKIELYGNAKDFPALKDKANQYESELRAAEAQVNSLRNQRVPEEDVRRAEENLRRIELDKLSAIGNREKTIAICEAQIQGSRKQLEKIMSRLQELNTELATKTMERQDIALQLTVNQDLFLKLREIVQTMGWRDDSGFEIFNQFMELSEALAAAAPPQARRRPLPSAVTSTSSRVSAPGTSRPKQAKKGKLVPVAQHASGSESEEEIRHRKRAPERQPTITIDPKKLAQRRKDLAAVQKARSSDEVREYFDEQYDYLPPEAKVTKREFLLREYDNAKEDKKALTELRSRQEVKDYCDKKYAHLPPEYQEIKRDFLLARYEKNQTRSTERRSDSEQAHSRHHEARHTRTSRSPERFFQTPREDDDHDHGYSGRRRKHEDERERQYSHSSYDSPRDREDSRRSSRGSSSTRGRGSHRESRGGTSSHSNAGMFRPSSAHAPRGGPGRGGVSGSYRQPSRT